MTTYCSHCDINWSALWSQDEGFDNYEFCPQCSSAIDLQAGTDIVGYIKCPITGVITNTTTGSLYQDESINKKPVYRIKVGKPARETLEEKEARETAAIDAYHSTGDPKIYFQTIKKTG